MSEESSNKRIAKNAVYLYLRTIVTTIVGIYTSRVVLQTLGVEDYGLYNVAGGVVGMLAFINGSMYGATTRYLTYELGSGNVKRLASTFSSSIFIHCIIGVVVLIVAESIGLWFLNNKLVFPEGRLWAAQCVYHLSIFSTVLGIVQTPYESCMIAHERFDVIAFLNMFTVFAKLGILFVIMHIAYDNLVSYAIFIFVIKCSSLLFVYLFCKSKFIETRSRFSVDAELIKPMFKFFGWEIVGGIGRVSRVSGVNMVINMFCGVVVNAAVGIGNTVSGAVNGLAYNIVSVFQPKITKSYARNDMKDFEQSVIRASSLSFMLFAFFSVPFIVQCDYILYLWLKEPPIYASKICAIHLFFNVFLMTDSVLGVALKAMNRNRGQNVIVCITGILTILLVYLSLLCEYNILISIIIFDSMILVNLGYNIRLLAMHAGKSIAHHFVLLSIIRVVMLILIALLFTYLFSMILSFSFLSLVLTVLFSTAIISLEIFYFILSSQDRKQILSIIKQRLRHYK